MAGRPALNADEAHSHLIEQDFGIVLTRLDERKDELQHFINAIGTLGLNVGLEYKLERRLLQIIDWDTPNDSSSKGCSRGDQHALSVLCQLTAPGAPGWITAESRLLTTVGEISLCAALGAFVEPYVLTYPKLHLLGVFQLSIKARCDLLRH